MEAITLKLCCEKEEEQNMLQSFKDKLNADILFLNAEVSPESCESFISFTKQIRKSENVTVILATNGGDADSAYRMARFLKKAYKMFSLYIYGFCKSAGTLFALGADEIIMGPRGEFGPLDVQVFSPDEFMQRSSGLSIYQSLESVAQKSFELFEEIFLSIRRRSGGVITTQTASEIACKMAIGLYAPITSQIDSSRIGELQRFLDIAIHYGIRLGASEKIVRHLATQYPSHSFVIDRDEASQLFPCVRPPEEFEWLLRNNIKAYSIENYGTDLTRFPVSQNVMGTIILEDNTNEDTVDQEGAAEEQSKTSTRKKTKPKKKAPAE
ncbi:hypothetical protein [Desulfonatronum sp. SC1]|uniref:SDH family Clp fold serine proteinase n=1 Tax=Desulfonatronum sp. SC1 TaxID=2109626 RepID=UPI000D31D1E2|nr:hypothetical protein [Desulfonatronum sp. SC1]PTN36131.1 hypothetical protein C6366_10375 [Desulfonatronum sp. SC1]